jgi:cytochrome bd ubiquinol oxidase subunit I
LPWIAAELGWIVAECGRQPWAVDGLLPTFLGVSTIPLRDIAISLAGFVIFYSALAAVDVFLMVRMIKRGPGELGYWPDESPAPGAGSGGDTQTPVRPVVAG